MTTAPALWSNLPNLKAFSLTEGLRLGLIVGSLSFVILAGQFAQSRGQELSAAATQNILASASGAQAANQAARPHHKATTLERYANKQVHVYSQLLDGLTERAEILMASGNVSNEQAIQLKTSLRDLDETLMQTREALKSSLHASENQSAKEAAFEEEDLRGTLTNLQDAASVAQGEIINLDR